MLLWSSWKVKETKRKYILLWSGSNEFQGLCDYSQNGMSEVQQVAVAGNLVYSEIKRNQSPKWMWMRKWLGRRGQGTRPACWEGRIWPRSCGESPALDLSAELRSPFLIYLGSCLFLCCVCTIQAWKWYICNFDTSFVLLNLREECVNLKVNSDLYNGAF